MMNLVTGAITDVLGWVGTVVTSLISENGQLSDLAPLFAIGIAISAVLLGVKIIKSVVWGA